MQDIKALHSVTQNVTVFSSKKHIIHDTIHNKKVAVFFTNVVRNHLTSSMLTSSLYKIIQPLYFCRMFQCEMGGGIGEMFENSSEMCHNTG